MESKQLLRESAFAEVCEPMRLETNKPGAVALQRLVLGSILLGAFVVRVWGINFGLPDIYHWDEYTDFQNALWAANDGLRMGNFVGASLPYLDLGIYGLVFLFLRLTGRVVDFTGFESMLFADPTPALLGGRIAAVIAGVATIWLTYHTANLLYGEARTGLVGSRIGLLAAALLALTSLHVQDSHYARGHVFAAFFILVVLYFSFRLVVRPRTRYYIFAGGAIALATGTEFYAPVAAILLLVGHLLSIRTQGLSFNARTLIFHRPFLLGSVGAALMFLAITPAIVLDFGYFLGWMRWYVQDNNGAWVDPEGLSVGIFYLTEHLRYGMGEPFLALSLVGMGFLAWRRRKADILLLSFPLIFFYILHKGPNHARFALPILPFLSIAAAVILDRFYRWLKPGMAGKNFILVGVVIIVLVPSAIDIARFNTYLGLKDTRSQAREWIEKNVPENATVIVEGGHGSGTHGVAGPQLSKNSVLINKMLLESEKTAEKRFIEAMQQAKARDRVYEVYDVMRIEQITSLNDFKDVQYIVTSSWALNKTGRASAYGAMLAKDYTLMATLEPTPDFRFDPYTWRMDYTALRSLKPGDGSAISGPKLQVFKRKTSNET